jgi:hypothetical protein
LCRNCLLRQVIEGKIKGGIEVTGRWGRRHRKLLDDLKERRGCSWLKEEAHFGRCFGPVVRQTAMWMNEFTLTPVCTNNEPGSCSQWKAKELLQKFGSKLSTKFYVSDK